MKKVLVTGASGFLGSTLIKRAAQKSDWDLYAVVSGKRAVEFPENVKIVVANILEDVSYIREINPDIVIHMAWGFGNSNYRASTSNILWLEASLSLLREFAESGGKYFFFAGSSSEYGHNLDEMCVESHYTQPEDLYGMCKNSFNRLASMFCSLNGIKYSSGRIFTVYGAGDRHLFGLIPSAIKALAANEDFSCREPEKKWNFIYSEDVVSAIIKAIENYHEGIFNIAGETATVYDVLKVIHKYTKSTGEIKCDGTSKAQNGLIADTHILRNVIGFVPQIDLNEGIRRTVEWWNEERLKMRGSEE